MAEEVNHHLISVGIGEGGEAEGDGEINIDEVNAYLTRIHTLLKQRKDLSKKLRFRLSPKEGRAEQLSKIYKWTGPDDQTLGLLQSNAQRWMDDPSSFWLYALSPAVPRVTLSPDAQLVYFCLGVRAQSAHTTALWRLGALALSDYRSLHPNVSEAGIAKKLFGAGVLPTLDMATLLEQIKEVFNAGNRYALVEKETGKGITILLGLMFGNQW